MFYIDFHMGQVGPKKIIDFFRSKGDFDILFELFLNELKTESKITQLSPLSIKSQIIEYDFSLDGICDLFLISKFHSKIINYSDWKKILLSLIEKGSKKEETLKSNLWFVCYKLNRFPIKEILFAPFELVRIKKEMSQLKIEDITTYLGSDYRNNYKEQPNFIDETIAQIDQAIKQKELVNEAIE